MKLCLIRSLRHDRTKIAAREFIKEQLGNQFIEPVSNKIADIFDESKSTEPIMYLLTAGADPTQAIDDLGNQLKVEKVDKVSMGEGQEKYARKGVLRACANGTWIILCNCHLGINYMQELVEFLQTDEMKNANKDTRIWITTEESQDFPLALL